MKFVKSNKYSAAARRVVGRSGLEKTGSIAFFCERFFQTDALIHSKPTSNNTVFLLYYSCMALKPNIPERVVSIYFAASLCSFSLHCFPLANLLPMLIDRRVSSDALPEKWLSADYGENFVESCRVFEGEVLKEVHCHFHCLTLAFNYI